MISLLVATATVLLCDLPGNLPEDVQNNAISLLASATNTTATITIPAQGKHTHTVILLHGMYVSGDMFRSVPFILSEHLEPSSASGIKYLFPTAPLRQITWGESQKHMWDVPVTAWYDYFTDMSGEMEQDRIDLTHLQLSSTWLRELMTAEVELLGGDSSKVIVGGNSQGATVALDAALSLSPPLAAVISLRSLLLDHTAVKTGAGREPQVFPQVFTFIAEKDSVYLPALQQKSYNRLRDAGYSVTEHTEPGLTHETQSRAEMLWAASWIATVFFQKPISLDNRTASDGDSDADTAPVTNMFTGTGSSMFF